MSDALPKACPRCPRVRPCPHHPERMRVPWAGHGAPAARGYGEAWRELRRMFLELHPFCELCRKAGHYIRATEVDHRVPKAEGGTNSVANLQALCADCHKRKSSSEGGRAAARRRRRRRAA